MCYIFIRLLFDVLFWTIYLETNILNSLNFVEKYAANGELVNVLKSLFMFPFLSFLMSRSELVLFVSALSLEIQSSSGKIGIPLTCLPPHIWGPGGSMS
jgi:hypothetical protein